MKKFILLTIFFLVFIVNFTGAQTCPERTTAGYDKIIFVGKITSLGNDSKVSAWFEYGIDKNNLKKTKEIVRNDLGIYCLEVKNLTPCTTYFYRAAVKNEKGTAYGELKNIKTLCSAGKINNNNSSNKDKNISNTVVSKNSIDKNNGNNGSDFIMESPSQPLNLELNSQYSVSRCSINELKFTLTNLTGVNRRFVIIPRGEVSSWFSPNQLTLTLAPYSSEQIKWQVNVPCNAETKAYLLTFNIKTSNLSSNYTTNLQVKGGILPLLGFAGILGGNLNLTWLLVFILIVINIFLWRKIIKNTSKNNVI